jgi:WXG100 family type VII secretion target
MSDLQVTPEYVSQAAASCKSAATEIQEQLAALQQYIAQMEGWWQGIASSTFQDLMTEYSTYSAMLHNALNDIGTGLTGNYVNYTDTEQANVTTITSIQNALSSTNFS